MDQVNHGPEQAVLCFGRKTRHSPEKATNASADQTPSSDKIEAAAAATEVSEHQQQQSQTTAKCEGTPQSPQRGDAPSETGFRSAGEAIKDLSSQNHHTTESSAVDGDAQPCGDTPTADVRTDGSGKCRNHADVNKADALNNSDEVEEPPQRKRSRPPKKDYR